MKTRQSSPVWRDGKTARDPPSKNGRVGHWSTTEGMIRKPPQGIDNHYRANVTDRERKEEEEDKENAESVARPGKREEKYYVGSPGTNRRN